MKLLRGMAFPAGTAAYPGCRDSGLTPGVYAFSHPTVEATFFPPLSPFGPFAHGLYGQRKTSAEAQKTSSRRFSSFLKKIGGRKNTFAFCRNPPHQLLRYFLIQEIHYLLRDQEICFGIGMSVAGNSILLGIIGVLRQPFLHINHGHPLLFKR